MKIGYCRVSSLGQNEESQRQELLKFGCDIIRSEKVSGSSLENRLELESILAFIRSGDQLVVQKIDRLARSISDLNIIVNRLNEVGASLVTTDGMQFDTNLPSGKLMVDILGSFAEFELSLRKERIHCGIRLAKEKGVYKGRKAT